MRKEMKMERKNIFEQLSDDIDLKYEIKKLNYLSEKACIYNMFEENSFESFINKYCLSDWANRNRCVSCKEIKDRLGISTFDFKNAICTEKVITYLEYLSNMVLLCNSKLEEDKTLHVNSEYNFLIENSKEIIELLNYEIAVFKDEEKVLLYEKSPQVTAAVEICPKACAYDIVRYNHYTLKGQVEEKRRILKVLADRIEPIRKEFKELNIHKSLESDVGFLLNNMNIRQNNTEGKNAIQFVQNLSEEELEEWYDETYQLILLCLLEHDNIVRNKKIENLKRLIQQV